MRIGILTLFLASCLPVESQIIDGDFVEGWILTKSGDSIKGFIQQKMVYSGTLKYRANKSGKSKKIKAGDAELLHVGNVTYHSLVYRKNKYLMKQIISGEISLFSIPIFDPNISNFNRDSRYSNEEYYLKRKDLVAKVRKDNFRNLMANYVAEYDELAKKLKNKDYTYNDLIDIVSDFNYWYNYTR